MKPVFERIHEKMRESLRGRTLKDASLYEGSWFSLSYSCDKSRRPTVFTAPKGINSVGACRCFNGRFLHDGTHDGSECFSDDE